MATFGRFLDSWVVDRVMFEFVNQGGCSCCGLAHGGMDMADFMALCSDVETDDGKTEKLSPWPRFMVEEVWADRVKFRQLLKKGIPRYRELEQSHGGEFVEWWLGLSVKARKSVFQMPKDELQVQFNHTFDFKAAYKCVLCSVIEQVDKFDKTGYKADGASDYELALEKTLTLSRGAWTVSPDYYETDDGCDMFFGMILQLGGNHLMPKRPQDLRDESEQARAQAEGGADVDGVDTPENNGGAVTQSFRSDRRLVRLLIFRYFADIAWRKFLKFKGAQENQVASPVQETEVTGKIQESIKGLSLGDPSPSAKRVESESVAESAA